MRTLWKRYYRNYKKAKAKRLFSTDENRFGAYKRVYHVHIRKCGGTSINSSFWQLGGLNLGKIKREPIAIAKEWVFVRNNLTLIEQGNYHFGNSHIPFWNLKLPKDTFTFCMLRDPYQRLCSLYKYYLWIANGNRSEVRKHEPYFDSLIKKIPKMGANFSEFLDNLPEKHLQNQLYMFSETMNLEEAVKSVNTLDRVYFQAYFSDGIEDLSSTLGVPLSEKRERSFKMTALEISDMEKQKAMDLLEVEYKLYEYFLDRYNHDRK